MVTEDVINQLMSIPLDPVLNGFFADWMDSELKYFPDLLHATVVRYAFKNHLVLVECVFGVLFCVRRPGDFIEFHYFQDTRSSVSHKFVRYRKSEAEKFGDILRQKPESRVPWNSFFGNGDYIVNDLPLTGESNSPKS